VLASSLSRPPMRAPQSAPLPSSPSLPDARHAALVFVDRSHPQRPELESFIQAVYGARYGARLHGFMPMLVALRDAQGDLLAAAGYRDAGTQPLYLERYLDRPVEQLLATGAGGPPARARIAEVGHLAAAQAGQGRRLILQLGPQLAAQGFEWVVSTLTEELRHLFRRLGLAPLALGMADPALLGPEAADWGSYYEHRPLVLAGQIGPALQALARQRGAA
jgi:hypothetical protein